MDLQRSDHPHICVTVCTRERPVMLARLIDSFSNLALPEGVEISMIVVENDTSQKVDALVKEKAASSSQPIHYRWESRLGIPIARNLCVREANALGATHIAFVDDDEWLPEQWLTTLWEYYLTQDSGSVIQGPVISELPESVSPVYKDVFQRKIKKTGEDLHMCMTNNVLVPLSMFADYDLEFDETHPLAGGTDSKLFRAAYAKGVKLTYCAEAKVFEEVPIERVTYRWLSKRHFRIGLTLGEHAPIHSSGEKALYCSSNAAKSTFRFTKSLFYYVTFNRKRHLKHWLKGCKLMGQSLGPMGVKVNSYKKIEGS